MHASDTIINVTDIKTYMVRAVDDLDDEHEIREMIDAENEEEARERFEEKRCGYTVYAVELI